MALEQRLPDQGLELLGIEVRGHSIGGLETCIDLPQFRIAFDVGRAPEHAIARPTILFTHAHMDHMGGVAYHCATRALRKLAPPTYVVGPENADAFRDLFDVWRRLDRSTLEHRLVVAAPGDVHVLSQRNVVRPFRSLHRAPCQGYAIWERKTRLRRDLAHLDEDALRAVRERGESVSETVETPQVAFCGDTLIDVVEREEVVRKARLLILETTFLDDRVSVAESRDKGHVHLDEVCERADLFENEAILLTHFSARYTPSDVRAILAARLPASLRDRVVPFLPA
jgi:ribonuclease Z